MKSIEEKVVLTIDVRGLLCPIPVQKTEDAIKKIEVGEVLEVIASDPMTLIDIPAWETKEKHRILRVDDKWLTIKFYIERCR
jgi:tRNA 2-thiouridine synthesizing protein A